jgi:hypothetical protein
MNINNFLFAGHLDEGEEIQAVVHRHVYIYLRDSFKAMGFGLLLPFFVLWVFPGTFPVVMLWLLFGVLGMTYHFIDWFFDAWLLTNMGIIDVEKNGLFDKSSTRIEYHMIEGIAYSVKGVLATFMGYGDITIDKMGTNTTVILKDSPSPKRVEKLLLRCQEEFVTERSYRDHSALKDMLSEMIAYHLQNDKIKKK